MILDAVKNRLAGYAFLIEKYRLSAMRNWHVSSVSQAGMLRSIIHEGQAESVFPLSYWPGDNIGDHLEFALKYDGVNLAILSVFAYSTESGHRFHVIPASDSIDSGQGVGA